LDYVELFVTLIEEVGLIVTMLAYLVTNTEYFKDILRKRFTLKNQIILIIIFGAVSIYGTYGGIIHKLTTFGAIANIRDLGPMIAGLVGGPFMGVTVGLIGGIHRYFIGGFTCLPCSLATVLAGVFAGIIYKLKKGRFIGVLGAVVFAVLMEGFHMLITLLLAQPFSEAVLVVKELCIPMIVANALGVMIFAFMISNKIKELGLNGKRGGVAGREAT
jgi:sigma-B regulation protein RsbU (phosphoserine phosphatase)